MKHSKLAILSDEFNKHAVNILGHNMLTVAEAMTAVLAVDPYESENRKEYEWQWIFQETKDGLFKITEMHYTEDKAYADWSRLDASRRVKHD